MPELPEVETVRRGLAPVMEGAVIAQADVNRPDLRPALAVPKRHGGAAEWSEGSWTAPAFKIHSRRLGERRESAHPLGDVRADVDFGPYRW